MTEPSPYDFLGHTTEYWLELQRRLEAGHSLRTCDLLEEIAKLRGIVNLIEVRVREIRYSWMRITTAKKSGQLSQRNRTHV